MFWEPTFYLFPIILAILSTALALILWRRRAAANVRLEESTQALRLSEQKYRTLVETSIDAIFLENLDGVVLDCNEAACAMHGYRKEELIGMRAADLVAPELIPRLKDVADEQLIRGWSRFEFTGRRKGGELFPSDVSVRRITLAGEPLVMVTVRDISERKQIEERQRQHEQFLTAINEMTRLTLAGSDLRETLQALADHMGEFVAADATYITLWDEKRQLPLPMAATGSLRDRYTSMRPRPGEKTATAAVLALGQAIIIEDKHNTSIIDPRIVAQFPGRSMLVLPLIAGEQKLGAALIAHNESRSYSPIEIEQGMQMARQISLAIAKSKSLEEARRRAAQQEALNKLIAAATTASSLAELLEIALDQLLQTTGLDRGIICMADQCIARNVACDQIQEIWRADRLWATGAVDDWQFPPSNADQDNGLASALARCGIRASLSVSHGPQNRLALLSPAPRSWQDSEIALLEGVSRQLENAAQRLQLMEHIRKQAEQLQQAIDAVPEGMILLDQQQRVLLTNPAADRLLQSLSNAGKGDVLKQLGPLPVASLLEGFASQSRHELRLQGTETGIFLIGAHPVALGPAQNGWILMIDDVTTERLAQELAQRQQRLAAIGQLAAGIAHDFNNILHSIIGFAELILQRGVLSADDRRRVELIAQQGGRGAALVRQILDFSRQSIPRRRRTDLVALLHESAEILRTTLPSSIELRVEIAQQVPPILADPAQLQQVLLNLCNNARDAMPKGGRITMRLEEYAPQQTPAPPPPRPGRWLLLTVSDTGQGIAANDLPHIFEPFFTTKLSGLGNGLGLAQVHGIIEQHDGAIQVSSQAGQGAHFFLYLPVSDLFFGDAEAEHCDGQNLLEPAVILLVAAQVDLADRLFRALEETGYRVVPVTSPQEALEMLQERGRDINLILVDAKLVDEDGVELAGEISSRLPATPLILLGHDPRWEAIEHRHRGLVTATVPMPLNEEELLRTLRAVFKGETNEKSASAHH